VNRHNLIRKI